VMGFTSHQQMYGGPADRVVECFHFSRQHCGDRPAPRRRPSHKSEVAPKWASGSTWFGWVFTESAGLSFCVLVAISPRRAKLGGGWPCPARGVRSVDTPPPTPAAGRRPPGGPVAGRSPIGHFHMSTMWREHVTSHMSHVTWLCAPSSRDANLAREELRYLSSRGANLAYKGRYLSLNCVSDLVVLLSKSISCPRAKGNNFVSGTSF
jgi:hypothetical protein